MSSYFEVLKQSKKSAARRGRIVTPHGTIETPAFVGVGTNGTLKALDNTLTRIMGLELMFCNTYHLILQPGTALIRSLGGLHQYIGFSGPLITDSGGFQVFSLAYGSVHQELKNRAKFQGKAWVVKINEEGVLFRSYRDGKMVHLTPESSVLAQKDLGADIIIPLDELPPYHLAHDALHASFARTHRWMERSLVEHKKNTAQQIMYGVIHGGLDFSLREKSIEILQKQDFDGLALGGSFGKDHQDLKALLEYCTVKMDSQRPRHLLGIADPLGMELAICNGIDSFDSSYPTKIARHGSLLTSSGMIKIRQSIYSKDLGPIDASCLCSTCKNHHRAFLHHLLKAHEPSFFQLASIHNLEMMLVKASQYRLAIEQDEL